MKKILFILMLFVLSGYSLTVRTWNSSGSTDMNDGANYTGGSGAISADDSLLFDATSTVNATATADLSAGAIVTTAGYSGAWSTTTRALTLAQGAAFDGTGTLTLGTGVIASGNSATFHIGSGVGTITATACILTLSGTTAMVLDVDKATTFRKIRISPSAVVTSSGGANTTITATATGDTCLVIGASASFTSNRAMVFTPKSGNSTIGVFQVPGSTFNGTGFFTMYGVGGNDSLLFGKITYTGSGLWSQGLFGKVFVTDSFNLGTAQFSYKAGFAGNPMTFRNTGSYFKCAALTIGTESTSAMTADYGNAIYDIASFAPYNNAGATPIDSFKGSTFNVSGAWTMGAQHTVVPGTSIINILNTSTVTTANKYLYDFAVNASGKTVTHADSVLLNGDYTIIAGTVATTGKHFRIGGDLTVSNGATMTDSNSYIYMTGSVTYATSSTKTAGSARYVFNAGSAHTFATGGKTFDSVLVKGSTSITGNSTMRLHMEPGLKVTNAGTLTLLSYDIEGTTGTGKDTLSGGTFDFPAKDSVSYVAFENVTSLDTLYADTTCRNLGGNSANIIFAGAVTSLKKRIKSALNTAVGLFAD